MRWSCFQIRRRFGNGPFVSPSKVRKVIASNTLFFCIWCRNDWAYLCIFHHFPKCVFACSMSLPFHWCHETMSPVLRLLQTMVKQLGGKEIRKGMVVTRSNIARVHVYINLYYIIGNRTCSIIIWPLYIVWVQRYTKVRCWKSSIIWYRSVFATGANIFLQSLFVTLVWADTEAQAMCNLGSLALSKNYWPWPKVHGLLKLFTFTHTFHEGECQTKLETCSCATPNESRNLAQYAGRPILGLNHTCLYLLVY